MPPAATKPRHQQAPVTPWYRAPVVWLAILLSLLILCGYSWLLTTSHRHAVERPAPKLEESHPEQLKQLLGMPLAPVGQPAQATTSNNGSP